MLSLLLFFLHMHSLSLQHPQTFRDNGNFLLFSVGVTSLDRGQSRAYFRYTRSNLQAFGIQSTFLYNNLSRYIPKTTQEEKDQRNLLNYLNACAVIAKKAEGVIDTCLSPRLAYLWEYIDSNHTDARPTAPRAVWSPDTEQYPYPKGSLKPTNP